MLAVKLLLLVLVVENIANASAKCTRIQLVVKAEYFESSLEKDYKHTRVASKSDSFQRSYNNLDISAAVSGSYGGFSGSASASFSQTSDFEQSRSESSDITKTSEITYAKGQNHLVEKITKTVTIDGKSKTVISREPKDFYLVKDSPTIKEMRKKEEDYIRYNFGGIPGGKIRKNVYSASACIKEPCEDDNRVFPFWVKQEEVLGGRILGGSILGGPVPLKCDSCNDCTGNTQSANVFCQDTRVKRRCKKSCGKCVEPPCEDDEDGYKRWVKDKQEKLKGPCFGFCFSSPSHHLRSFPRCSDYLDDSKQLRRYCEDPPRGFADNLKNVCRKSCGQCYD